MTVVYYKWCLYTLKSQNHLRNPGPVKEEKKKKEKTCCESRNFKVLDLTTKPQTSWPKIKIETMIKHWLMNLNLFNKFERSGVKVKSTLLERPSHYVF